jgi:hypothetical protein
MKIEVPEFDARTGKDQLDVIDTDTGMVVGHLHCGLGETGPAPDYFRLPSRSISLFDDKYWGRYASHKECQSFADGVAAVLNHLTQQNEVRFVQQEPRLTRRV